MPYQTYKKNVRLSPGEVLKFRKGRGYYAASGPTDQQQALAQVQAILGPQIADTNTAYRNQGAGLNAAYGAVAQMQQGVAPAIQGTYDAASARQSVIAKGFSDGFKMASEGAAGGLNKILADQGSSQTVTPAGQSGADVLYGLGGALPAGELNQQGAAFTAAARFLPGQSRQLGLDSLKASEQARIQAIRELEAKRPELYQSALGQISDAASKSRAAAVNEKLAASLIGDRTAGQKVAETRVAQNAKALRLRQSEQQFSQALDKAKLTLSKKQYRIAIARERRLSKPKQKGGFSATKLYDIQANAYESALTAYQGFYTDKNGTRIEVAHKNATETLRDLIGQGTPLSIALKVLKQLGSRPDAPPDWQVATGWIK